MLLSADGHDVAALTQALGVSSRTVYTWFNRWEAESLAGLVNAAGQGRRPILRTADEVPVAAAGRTNQQQIKEMTAMLRQELDKNFSPRILRRFLKSEARDGGAFATR